MKKVEVFCLKAFTVLLFCLLLFFISCSKYKSTSLEIYLTLNKHIYAINETIQCDIIVKNNTSKDIVMLDPKYNLGNRIVILTDKYGKTLYPRINYVHEGKIIDPLIGYFDKSFFHIINKGKKKVFKYEVIIKKADYIFLMYKNNEYFIKELKNGNEITFSILYDINAIYRLRFWINKEGTQLFPGYDFLEYALSDNNVAAIINDKKYAKFSY